MNPPAANDEVAGRYRTLLDVSPVAMVIVDETGKILVANAALDRLFGYGPGELVGQAVEALVPRRSREAHPTFRSGFFADVRARPMGAGRDLYGLRKDGAEVPVEIALNPILDGERTLVLGSIVDLTERKRAVEQFRLAIEASPTGMLMVDRQGKIALVNVQVERLFGYSRAELIGQAVEMLVPHRFRAGHAGFRTGFFGDVRARPMGAGRDLFGLRKDGSEVPIEIGLNPLATPEGTFVLSSIVDITERHRASEQLQASLAEKETLLKEVHHRVKNNLQVISSLLSLQAHHVSPELAHAFGEMQARVRSIALFHEKLYQSDDLAQVGFAEYLKDLSRSVLSQFEVEPGQVTLEVEVDPVRLGVDRAIPAGLIANELISNALKHAFPDRRRGKLSVRVTFEPPHTLVMTIADDGVGIPAEAMKLQAVKTLGLQLVSTLTRQLEGTVDISLRPAGGTCFTVRFPAPNLKVGHGRDSDRRG